VDEEEASLGNDEDEEDPLQDVEDQAKAKEGSEGY
jgi:hypothetical protein